MRGRGSNPRGRDSVGGALGNGYAGLRLRTTRRTKGSAHIAHAHPHQVLTGLKTFLFYHSTFLTGVTDASRARLRDVHFLALCSS